MMAGCVTTKIGYAIVPGHGQWEMQDNAEYGIGFTQDIKYISGYSSTVREAIDKLAEHFEMNVQDILVVF